jgi:RNA polymerase sigma-70 factor (ECF subfamily)
MNTLARNSNQNDSELIRQLKAGAHHAFEILVDRYTKKILHTAKRMHLREDDALEICQDVFLKLWETRDRLHTDGNIEAYIFTMVRNEVLKKIRKRAYRIVMEKYWVVHNSDATNDTERTIYTRDLEEKTFRIIKGFPVKQRKILLLRLTEYLSNEEIAEKLRLSKRTVENQVYRGMQKLRSLLSSELG